MTFNEAVATQPQWVQMWLNVLLLGAFVAPALMIIFKETRWFGLGFVLASVLGAFSVVWLYDMQGYTRLLGLPHLVVWIPGVAIGMRLLPTVTGRIPKALLAFTLIIVSISLAFDIADVARYIMGERGSMIPG